MALVEVDVASGGPIEPPTGALLGEPIAAWRERTRRELGVPILPGAILCGTGHQPGFWHPGILAKFIRARRLAGPAAAMLHLVVDHDELDPSIVRVPIRVGDRLMSKTHRLGPAPGARAAMTQPAFDPRPFDASLEAGGASPALPSVSAGLEAAAEALRAARSEPNSAMQVAAAVSLLMQPWAGETIRVPTSRLLESTLGHALIESMRRDPHRCVEAFNEALRIDPRAAKALRGGDDPELPLWTLDRSGRRERVTLSAIAGGSRRGPLLPRAFLVDAIARLALCDRFVHGTGARRYGRVASEWIRRWLGVELPPSDIASATCTLPLGPIGGPSVDSFHEQARRRAWWDPESLDDASGPGAGPLSRSAARGPLTGPGPLKRAMLAEIDSLPRRSPQRRAAHRRMLERLASLRASRAEAFHALDARIARDRERAAIERLAADRTWPFVYFEAAELDALASRIGAFAGAAGTAASSASGSGR